MWTKPLFSTSPKKRSALVLGLCVAAASLAVWTYQMDLAARSPRVVERPVARPESPFGETSEAALGPVPIPFTLRSGQTVSGLLDELGLDRSSIQPAVTALGERIDLRRVKAGETGLAYYTAAGELDRMRLLLAKKGWVSLDRSAGGWTTSWRELVRTVEVRRVEGHLDRALILDVERAGGPPQLAFAMSRVLQWDLDFNRDLRKGDHFRVVFEEIFLDGQQDGVGQVLALEYENQGVVHEAYLYDQEGDPGYYDGDGRPLQKMFLRSPLPFTRVTSRFSHRRFHPVLKRYRPHYGVDFGAPTGTPVRATAHGTATFVGWGKGAGKMVKLRHSHGYETMYLHLSKYGVRQGQRVRQGDVLGYVGSTGLSTGPHLDYRMKQKGKYINPMALRKQPAEPIPQHLLAEFLSHREDLRAALGGAPLELEGEARLAHRPTSEPGPDSAVGR
ncbi:MAG: peptidoglycan DD-metalloendopeptidase family protein [Acidobacteriota bacterium]